MEGRDVVNRKYIVKPYCKTGVHLTGTKVHGGVSLVFVCLYSLAVVSRWNKKKHSSVHRFSVTERQVVQNNDRRGLSHRTFYCKTITVLTVSTLLPVFIFFYKGLTSSLSFWRFAYNFNQRTNRIWNHEPGMINKDCAFPFIRDSSLLIGWNHFSRLFFFFSSFLTKGN